jgi:predicted helicase
MFPQNTERVERQKKAPLRVIMGNPPYSAGQKSANDNAQNEKYSKLDKRIASTYANATAAANKNSLYDSYIRSFRWSSDRLDKSGGIIAFVTNGGWLEGNSADGFRKVIKDEFSSIYVLNLRGNGRTSGERCRQEGEPLFAAHGGKGGSLTPITITFLVKNPEKSHSAEVFYHDIGMYLKRKEKLGRLKSFVSLSNTSWTKISPNEHGDWIGQRNNIFETFIPLASEKKFDLGSKSFFVVNSRGLETTRDAWVYSSSKEDLIKTIGSTIGFYNSEVERFQKAKQENSKLNASDFVNTDPTKISWSSSLIPQLERARMQFWRRKMSDMRSIVHSLNNMYT